MNNLLIILDLDETLVFSTEKPLARRADLIVGEYQVYKRPGLETFLGYCLDEFMVAVWTSSGAEYANSLVPVVFTTPSRLEFVWARDRCTLRYDPDIGGHHWIKNLQKIKRRGFSLERTLMIDDSPEKLIRNFGNHIRVTPFEGDASDVELTLLARYLETLKDVPNVRKIEKRWWKSTL